MTHRLGVIMSHVYTLNFNASALKYNKNNYSQLSMNHSEQFWEICIYICQYIDYNSTF